MECFPIPQFYRQSLPGGGSGESFIVTCKSDTEQGLKVSGSGEDIEVI